MINSNSSTKIKKEYKQLFILVLGFILYNLLFINKAFHIDDVFTIIMARAVNLNFFKVPEVCLSNPMLIGYYYAPIIKLFGEKEVWMHIFFLPFSLLAIISMFFLSLRFVGKWLMPTLSLVISPAFLLMSQGIMLDIPVLAFSLGGLAAFIYGVDRSDNRLLFAGSILAGIASLVKYSGLIFIPIMFIYALLFSRRRFYLFLLIPLFMFIILCLHNGIFYKHIPFMNALLMRINSWSIDVVLLRLAAVLSFLTGTSLITLFLICFLLSKKNNRFLFVLSVPLALCLFLLKDKFVEYSYLGKFFLAILFSASIFIILRIIKFFFASFLTKPLSKDNLFLSIWFLMFLVFTVAIQFIAARFILLLLPPMFLLIYHEIFVQKMQFFPVYKKAIICSIGVTFLISTVLAIGDYQFAGIYRNFARYLKKEFNHNESIHFCPDSYDGFYAWGYSYYTNKYFPRVGGSGASTDFNQMRDVYFIVPTESVLPMVIQGFCILEGHDKLDATLVKQVDYKTNVFLHNLKHRTGFYSHDWGLLPFKLFLHETTLERFCIYRL